MNIRQLRRPDAGAYQSLRLRALRENPEAFSASYEDEVNRAIDDVAMRVEPARDGSVCMFAAFENNQLAGFVAVIHPQRAKLRHAVELAGMYIAPESRRRGLGAALLQATISHVRSLDGVRLIRLGVNETSMAAKALYKSAGFECCGVEPDSLNINGTFYGEERYILQLAIGTTGWNH